jgi:uncharacterized protein (DUF302 family)
VARARAAAIQRRDAPGRQEAVMGEIGMRKRVAGRYDDVVAKVQEALKAEGFGVLTRIDVKATLKEKIGVDFRRYEILGACNPRFAHQALGIELGIGTMLPCNVAVWEEDGGAVTVSAVDPLQTIAAQDARLAPVAGQVRERLAAAMGRL